MSTQLYLATGILEGRASTWQDMASTRVPGRSPLRREDTTRKQRRGMRRASAAAA